MASRLPLILSCALLSGAAGAAELGEARTVSYIGQQLVADIELTALDAPAAPVQARLAHPNVYRGANIGMPHVLSTLSMSVTQRDGRQFLRVTSQAPVESSRLHLYLELLDGGGRNVRLVTLSLAPNPNPPPAPPVPVKAPAPVLAETPVVAPVAPPRPRLVLKPAPKPLPKQEPVATPKPEPAPTPEPAPKPAPLPLPVAAAAPASCAPASKVDQSTVCAALDYKNAQLREQIGELEGKVKVLQVALGANPADVGKTKVADPSKPHPSRRRPAPEPQPDTPWVAIGGGIAALLALVGAAIVLLRRRKRAGRIQPMPGVPLLARLRGRFARKQKSSQPVEPKLEEPAQEPATQA